MDLMSIGPVEILMVLLVTFLVLGPQRMINLAASFGKFIQEVKKTTSDIFNMATLEATENQGDKADTRTQLNEKSGSSQKSDEDPSIER